jgi:predicted ATPase
MTFQAFRIQNFMCFVDSGWVKLRPLSLFYGHNSAGKSAFLRALLLLRQSLHSVPEQGLSSSQEESPLLFVSDEAASRLPPQNWGGLRGGDFGSFQACVRDHDLRRCISFWFECALADGPEVATALSGLAVEGTTVQIRLSYNYLPSLGQVALQGVGLYDQQETIIWQAQRLAAGTTQAWRFEADFLKAANSWPLTARVVSEGFFPRLDVRGEAESKGQEFCYVQQLLNACQRSILQLFNNLQYLGPTQPEPQRFYDLAREKVGANGQHLLCRLLSDKQALSSVNQWLREFGFQVHLEGELSIDTPTQIQVLFSDASSRSFPPFQVNIREAGFGFSQIFAIVAQTLLAPRHATLIIEQPELHLHPRAQGLLGDLFIQVAVRHQVCLLVESYSETLYIRMRRRVAESSRGTVSPDGSMYLPLEALGMYFVDREEEGSRVGELKMGQLGELMDNPLGFKGFFSEDTRETVLFVKAQRNF